MQTLESVPQFVRDTAVMSMLAKQEDLPSVLAIIIEEMINIGLRCPSETTFRVFVGFILLLCFGFRTSMEMTPLVKFQILQDFKRKFKLRVKLAPLPRTIITVVPGQHA